VEEVEPLYTVGGNVSKMVHLLWRTVWQFLKISERKLPQNPAIPLLGIYPKGLKAGS